MATEHSTATKEVMGWLELTKPQLQGVSHAIILGLGNGEHICQLAELYSQLSLTVVDPRINGESGLMTTPGRPLQYVITMTGVETLQIVVRLSPEPIPILCYQPCWYPEKVFFQWAHQFLLELQAPKDWRGTPSEFILESLFK